MAERIAANTGPLVALARADALDLAGKLAYRFVCPPQVRKELDDGAASGRPVVDPPWLEVVPLAHALDPVAVAALDPAEAAVIQLAVEQDITLVCIDETRGRRAALAAGLRVTGALGLLVRAKTLGLTPSIRPIIERMTARGVWYDDNLVSRILHAVGE